MLVGVAGSLFSGRRSLAKWLVTRHGFRPILLLSTKTTTESPSEYTEYSYQNNPSNDSKDDELFSAVRMTVEDLMEFILKEDRWTQNWVVFPIKSSHQLSTLRKRPFFLLLTVHSSHRLCFERYCLLWKYPTNSTIAHTEYHKMLECEEEEHGDNFYPLRHADMIVRNSHQNNPTLEHYHDYIDNTVLPSLLQTQRLRPSWDDYFMLLADLAAHRSNCMKRRVGCILVRDCKLVATGYNGTPRGLLNCCDGGCSRCNSGNARCGEGLDECLCLHAEENALLEAGRERISGTSPTTLYCNTCPCLSCAKKIVQTGVREVVYRLEYGSVDSSTASLFQKAGVKLRQHQPLLSLNLISDI